MIVEQKYSYEELARILGITPGAARALASRHAWRRVRHIDGKVRVIVPSDALEGRRPGELSQVDSGTRGGHLRSSDPETTASLAAPSTPPRSGLTASKRRPGGVEPKQSSTAPKTETPPGRPGPAMATGRGAPLPAAAGPGHAVAGDDTVVSLQIRVAGLEGQLKALTVRVDAERRRADEAVMERNEWRALAQVLAESIPDGLRWWRRARN